MTPEKFKELLERARATTKEAEQKAKLELLASQASTVNSIDLSLVLGKEDKDGVPFTDDYDWTDDQQDAVVEFVRDITSNESTALNTSASKKVIGVARDDIILNSRQQEFHDAVLQGQDCICIGAAGTGKTTSVRKISRSLIESSSARNIFSGTKWLVAGKPGIAVLSYTRKAVNNIRHAVVDELKAHTLTCHKLLEFAPKFYEIEDPENKGYIKSTMRFEPQRNEYNPLPRELTILFFEESSMIAGTPYESNELYNLVQKAMPHRHQEIFLGDLQQLPPIFGQAILGFKLLELKVIELTEVYRQALNSPIINLAWKILEGNPHIFDPTLEFRDVEVSVNGVKKTIKKRFVPSLEALEADNEYGTLRIQPWQKSISPDDALFTTVKQFNVWSDQGYYNPEKDIILCPYNEAFGTIELNKGIHQYQGKKRGAIVHEIIAGFQKHYLAIGDRVLYDKEDAFIVDIARNSDYMGKSFQPASISLDRWGHLQEELTEQEKLKLQTEQQEANLEDIEKYMQQAIDNSEDRVKAASHVVVIRLAYADEGETIELDTAGSITNLLGGNAITVHKFQGSEEERVFFVLHSSHAVLVSRELLYTGVTRARKFLHIICEPTTFFKGVKSQRIKGNTLQEKAEFFKGKMKNTEVQKQLEVGVK